MAFDLPDWLKKDMGLSDDAVAAVSPHLDATKLEKAILRQQDYSKRMDELTAKVTADQQALATAQERLSAEIEQWAQIQNGTKAEQEKALKDLTKAQQDVVALSNALRTHAGQMGLDGNALVTAAIGGQTPPVTPPTQPTATFPDGFDPKNFATVQNQRQLANLAVSAPAMYAKLQREYRKYHNGEEFDETTLANEVLKRAHDPRNTKSLEMTDIFEEMFNMPAKRQEAEEARVNKLVADAEAKGRQAAMSELSVPGGGVQMPGRHSPVFAREGSPVLQRPAGQNPTVPNSAAVEALMSGKYRQNQPAGAGGR